MSCREGLLPVLMGYWSEGCVEPREMIVLPSYPDIVLAVSIINRISIIPISACYSRRRRHDFEWPLDHHVKLSKYRAAHCLITLLSRDAVHVLNVPDVFSALNIRSVCTLSMQSDATSLTEARIRWILSLSCPHQDPCRSRQW